MDRVKIAVLDSGIDTKNPYFMEKVYKGEGIYFDGTKPFAGSEFNDDNGHGSLCTSVILKECKEVQLYVMKVIDKWGLTNLEILEYALERLLYEDVDIISISLAIVKGQCSKRIRMLCDCLCKKGTIIICSFANGKRESYPASFKSVWGVRGFILENEKAFWERKRGKEFIVDYNPYLHLTIGGEYVLYGKSNSYACAKMTGIVARIMRQIDSNSIQAVRNTIIMKAERHNWIGFRDLKKSKRFPNFYTETKYVDSRIVRLLTNELKIEEKEMIYQYNLFDSHIGLNYKNCGRILKKIEKLCQFKIPSYELVSRYDFYSIYTLSDLIKRYN